MLVLLLGCITHHALVDSTVPVAATTAGAQPISFSPSPPVSTVPAQLYTIGPIELQYLARIRRQVNYYWSQNIDRISPSVQLPGPVYETAVKVTLDRNGALDSIVVTHYSGNSAVDECVPNAFKLAGPFPNPPAEMIGEDGLVHLPDFDFTVRIGQPQVGAVVPTPAE